MGAGQAGCVVGEVAQPIAAGGAEKARNGSGGSGQPTAAAAAEKFWEGQGAEDGKEAQPRRSGQPVSTSRHALRSRSMPRAWPRRAAPRRCSPVPFQSPARFLARARRAAAVPAFRSPSRCGWQPSLRPPRF
jgi:hypothetical protein